MSVLLSVARLATRSAAAVRTPAVSALSTSAASCASSHASSFVSSHALLPCPQRAVIGCRGVDAVKFLQGLTTNDVAQLQGGSASVYTAFLNNKGRTAFEGTISLASQHTAEQPFLLVDVPAAQLEEALAHLKHFKLRAKVDVLDLSKECAVRVLLHNAPLSHGASEHSYASAVTHVSHEVRRHADAISSVAVDARHPRLGVRVIAPLADTSLAHLKIPTGDAKLHDALRYLMGAPEGADVADAIPHEWNLPQLRGVSFDKGCYLGQEIVARAEFRGVVRKRLLPAVLHVGASNRLSHVQYVDEETAGTSAAAHHGAHAKASLPLPFVSTHWHGPTPAAGANYTVQPSASAAAATTAAAGGSGSERTGKLVSHLEGTNLAFVSMRLEHIPFTLPAPGASHTLSADALRKACAEHPVAFSLPVASADAAATDAGAGVVHMTPLLPPYWTQMKALPVETA